MNGSDNSSRTFGFPPCFFALALIALASFDPELGREIELMGQLDEVSAKYEAAREADDFDIALVFAGETVGLIHDIPSAHDVIELVMRQASALLYPVVVIGGQLDLKSEFDDATDWSYPIRAVVSNYNPTAVSSMGKREQRILFLVN